MSCGNPIASSPSCWSLFGSGEEGLRSMFKKKKKSIFAWSRSVRTQRASETQCLLSASCESVATTTAKPGTGQSSPTLALRAPLSFSAFYDEQDAELQMPATPVPAASAVPAVIRQESRLLSLPQEIRDEIYAHVFGSTRLAMGRRITCSTAVPSSSAAAAASPGGSSDGSTYHSSSSSSRRRSRSCSGHINITRIRPARHSLALFRVCRQIHDELRADDAWLGHVLFDFADIATMLDVLGGTSSPHSPLAQPGRCGRVRQVRVREGGLARATPHRGTCGFLLGSLMRLLPDLRLDRLTVLPALPCRVHGPACCYGAGTGGGNGRVASHDVLAELLCAGQGWRELCYVHHDVVLLAAERRRRRSHGRHLSHQDHQEGLQEHQGQQTQRALEAMMVSMGFWGDDADVHENAFGFLDRQQASRPSQTVTAPQSRDQQQQTASRLRRSSSVFTAYAETREYRLPRWQAMLSQRDGRAGTTDTDAVVAPDSQATPPRSSVDVYSMRDSLALRPVRTLADVYMTRLRGDDFIVVARREENWPASSDAGANAVAGSPYPSADGDPRTLGYGTTWEELRSFLFTWDYMPETRCRYDRYVHRDEYDVGLLRHPCSSSGSRRK